jgi:hypothetical protein
MPTSSGSVRAFERCLAEDQNYIIVNKISVKSWFPRSGCNQKLRNLTKCELTFFKTDGNVGTRSKVLQG